MNINNTPQFLCQSPPGCQTQPWLHMYDLVLSSPPNVCNETSMAPISQKQAGKMRDLLQTSQLLGQSSGWQVGSPEF